MNLITLLWVTRWLRECQMEARRSKKRSLHDLALLIEDGDAVDPLCQHLDHRKEGLVGRDGMKGVVLGERVL